uniref:Uncharacterized protein n=1 Tax=Octopus bimaculoides TaxID=37653 RepID=A0A0L8HS81_OCTBM
MFRFSFFFLLSFTSYSNNNNNKRFKQVHELVTTQQGVYLLVTSSGVGVLLCYETCRDNKVDLALDYLIASNKITPVRF